MKKLTIGIIAHVDSGKTTLSEALLYLTGTIRNFGRVDKGASFLDNDSMERKRGITIYSKQARFSLNNTEVVMIDTPGHADFSAEMERVLQVLDYAILLISALDGIKGQTLTLWKLLKQYRIPTFVFFNKMDMNGADKKLLLQTFKNELSSDAVDFSLIEGDEFYDQAAMCSEEAMEEYLESGKISLKLLQRMIAERKLFPCLFGSALKMQGIKALIELLDTYTFQREYPADFGARVYKILRDSDGSRLTCMKITGGELKVRTLLKDGEGESKINQLRFYSGTRFELRDVAKAGEICCVTGLKESQAGEGYGFEQESNPLHTSPILSYRVSFPNGEDPLKMLPLFRALEEENPELSVDWNEDSKEIQICVMGEVQLEILTSLMKERFKVDCGFDTGRVMYRETIARAGIGLGHFEPLRHFAEVRLLMEPLERGSGLVFESKVSTDVLSRNWQRLILTHLAERRHFGVLTRSPITDMRITVISGKAHIKHTEGGDFRQALYRAVRHGLMMTDSVLLEPYYRFVLELPSANAGRAMTDLDRMHASFSAPDVTAEGNSVIRGRVAVTAMKEYPRELAAYTKGQGRITLVNDGYDICEKQDAVLAERGYDPLSDTRNTADSVFCTHGAGYVVPFDEVQDYMGILDEAGLETLGRLMKDDVRAEGINELLRSIYGDDLEAYLENTRQTLLNKDTRQRELSIGTEEIDTILERISRSNSKEKKTAKQWKKTFGTTHESSVLASVNTASAASKVTSNSRPHVFSLEQADTIVVDGYNVIFAWNELADLARKNIDSARDALIDKLSLLKSLLHNEVHVVFDAYRVKDHKAEQMKLQDIRVIFTGEEETADQYIEKYTNAHGRKEKIAVVTSDGLEQLITGGQGALLVSSREFKIHLERLSADLREKHSIIK